MKVKNDDQVIELLGKNSQEFSRFGVKRIGIFGSFARSRQNDKSDVDLLIEFKDGKKNYQNFIGTATFAESILGREVDLLTPQSVSPYLSSSIKSNIRYVEIS